LINTNIQHKIKRAMPTLRLTTKLIVALAAAEVSIAFFAPNAFITKSPSIDRHRLTATADTHIGFEYNTTVATKGRLVVTFEPDSDDTPAKKPDPPSLPKEVFRGVRLPEGQVPPKIEHPFTEEQAKRFAGESFQLFQKEFLNRPKANGLDKAHALVVETMGLGNNIPNPRNYKHFGNGEHAKNLVYLLKTNPFMASCLTKHPSGFELLTFDVNDPDAKLSTATLYRKIMSTLNGSGHRVNIVFDDNMEIKHLTVFDDLVGKNIAKPSEEGKAEYDKSSTARIESSLKDTNKWASSALYNMLFYASCQHATIHALHYLMTSALQYASQDFKELNIWAESYAANVVEKYDQVGTLLIAGPAPMPLEVILDSSKGAESFLKANAVITGAAGFGSSQSVRLILKDLLNTWTKAPKAKDFLENTIPLSPEEMEKAGILTEFTKHSKTVNPFAADTTRALREIDEDKCKIAELRMKAYLSECGIDSDINSLEDWIELMSVTGITHGSTLSYTRMFGFADVLRWREIQDDKWDSSDLNLLSTGLATVAGMDEGRHVMMSRDAYHPELRIVLNSYDARARALKDAYKTKIMEDDDVFNDYGWILSDFCPDGFDGKQLTIATYI
jgi:hypothetical protein